MSVRFVLGRAGSGKTHHCLEEITQRLGESALDGPRLIMLVPEQASLQMERAVVRRTGVGVVHRAEVLSFRRLALRVLHDAGGGDMRALSEPARAMVLRHLVAQNASSLRYYRRVERISGFIERLERTITELIQEAIEPADLAFDSAQGDSNLDMDPDQRAKFHDIQFIYAAYLEYLGSGRLDPSQHLGAARKRLGQCPWLNGAQIWVDGFASFARQETLVLVELARLATSIEITVLADPSLCAPDGGSDSREGNRRSACGDLFARTAETFRDLRAAMGEAGVIVVDPLLLAPAPLHRFATAPVIANLERDLFVPGAAKDEAPSPGPSAVELVELPSRRAEVDFAVSRICHWVQDEEAGVRYRDIALIVRDLDLYHDLLSPALDARHIPYFIDRRRPIAHHPLIELLRSAVALAAERYSIESMRCALKTGLLPVSTQDADALENHLLAAGICGANAWTGEDWAPLARTLAGDHTAAVDPREAAAMARINASRRALVAVFAPWLDAATGPAPAGQDWAVLLTDLIERLDVGEQLAAWALQAEAQGDLDQAEEHRQVWRDALSFLDDLAFAFFGTALSIDELAAVLESGLGRLTLGLAPPMLDQILVGSIERSRHPEIKAAVVLGFNDGVFPAEFAEDSVLNDDDRALLRRAGLPVRPPSTQRVLDEALLVYIAATRASNLLVVTWAASDNDGRSLRPSPYLSALVSACPTARVVSMDDPQRARATWDILTPADLVRRVAAEFRSRPARKRDDPAVRGRWNELYEAVRTAILSGASPKRVWSGLGERPGTTHCPDSSHRWHGSPLTLSVSRLESYAACPFQYFARYVLDLREREEAQLEPVDVGSVHHAIAEEFVDQVSSQGRSLTQLDDAELMSTLQASCDRVAARLPKEGLTSGARDAYVLRRSAANLARVMRAQRARQAAGSAKPRATEVGFGVKPRDGRKSTLPALQLTTPLGRSVRLRGYIDRVDVAELTDDLLGVVVLDYKSAPDTRLDLSRVYHGLSLQLLAYALVLAEHGKTFAGRAIRPIGALYVSLASRYHSVDHPDDISERDAALLGTSRPRGLLDADAFDSVDSSVAGGWSQHYAMFLKKGGEIGQLDRSDAADTKSFQAVLAHTRFKLGELADGIFDGDFSVKPSRLGSFSSCAWCVMKPVCRFEMGTSQVRFLDVLKRSEVFTRLE